jgi:hypothetical protein
MIYEDVIKNQDSFDFSVTNPAPATLLLILPCATERLFRGMKVGLMGDDLKNFQEF